ncbi:MAG: polyphenol oxidase family protein [Deltaproteobacteria bacterium]|nr:polyphenol oxidase family protein [Deltaproteobacteria bacterium]
MSAPHCDASLPARATVPALVLRPVGWDDVEGLVYGFGDRSVGAPTGTWTIHRQVHGATLVEPDTAAVGNDTSLPFEADALVLRRPGLVGGVRTADCVPLLLVAPGCGWAAAVHAGWRGTIAGIATAAVDRARRDGVDVAGLRAALGPSIGGCCYEVSREIAERFSGAGLPVLLASEQAGGTRLDLRAINAVLLERAGLPAKSIQHCGPCTRCACDRYHSFRADPQQAGRQLSWIGWEDRTPPPDR